TPTATCAAADRSTPTSVPPGGACAAYEADRSRAAPALRARGPVHGGAAGRRAALQVAAALRLPGPLVVPAGRDRPVRVHRPGGDGDLPDAVLHPVPAEGRLPRLLRAA